MVYATCDVGAFSHELGGYKYRKDFKVLNNDYNYTLGTNVKDVLCTCTRKPIAKYILPPTENSQHVISYPDCARVLYTAFMRQLRSSENKISKNLLSRYHTFCDRFFDEKIEQLLTDFTYDVEAWMNHIATLKKQNEVLIYYNNYKKGLLDHHSYAAGYNYAYTMFAKKEKQIVPGKKPKCRAISAAPPFVKWVMGPVVQKLEKIFHGAVDGYKMSHNGKPCKTWNDIEDMYEDNYRMGLNTIIDIDGSAWDSTQHYGMKYLTNKIYKYLYDHNKIKHIDSELFYKVAIQRKRKLTAKCYVNGKTKVIFSALIDSTTFSGSPDTTFMNTVSNLSLNHFIFAEYGISPDKYRLSTAGDDFNCCIAQEHNTKHLRTFIDSVWRGLGLLPKYVLHGDYSNITYCSTNVIPYKDADGNAKFKVVRQMDRMLPLATISEKALHYSSGRLKYHYQELINGLNTWAIGMPFYADFIKAYQKQHDSILTPYQFDPPGRAKMTFQAAEQYDEYNHRTMDNVRVSNRTPPAHYVYDFLREKHGLLKDNIEQISKTLTSQVLYSPYEPSEVSCTMDPYDMST